jgi:uncharacterized protein YoxC
MEDVMTSRYMLSHLCLRVWLRASTFVALLTSLVIILMAGRAQAALPMPAQYQECVVDHKMDFEQNGQHFAVITITKDVPNCQLWRAHRDHPILGDDNQPLGIDEWLRSVYAANQDKSVRRGCIPLPGRQPPEGASEEEIKFCGTGKTNYTAIVSERWKAYVYIPTTRMYTFFEQQALAAAKACSVLSKVPNPTDQVKKALEECAKSQVKEESGKPVLPPVQAANPDPLGDTVSLRSLLASAKMQIVALKMDLTVLKWDLTAAVTDRRNYSFGFALSSLCLGFTVIGGAGLLRSNRKLKKKSKQEAEELDRVQSELAAMSESAKRYIADASKLANQLSQKEADYNQLSAAAGDLGPLVKKLQGEIRAKRDEYDALLKNGMEVSRAHHEEREAERKRFAEQKRKMEREVADLNKAMNDLLAEGNEKAQTITKLNQELQAAQRQSIQAALAYASAPTPQTLPPPSKETNTPPSTETNHAPADFLSAQQKVILRDNDTMRTGLMDIIEERHPGESQIFGAVEATKLVSRAKEVVRIRGFEVASLDILDGIELASYLLSIFKEVERRYLEKRKRLEIVFQSVDDVRAVWRGVTTTRLVLDVALEALISDPLKDFFLDDAAALAKLLNISQLAAPISEVRSPVPRTLAPPDVFSARSGSRSEPPRRS